MASINTGRVILGGLVGGVVGNVCDFAWNMTVMKDDMTALATRFGVDPAAMNSFAGAAPWIAVDFVFGLLLVFSYAAMRPRFGPGPKTAIIAALILFVGVTAVLYGFTSMGMMPMNSFVKGSATALVSVVASSLVGASLYKEA
jgi:hypothetical protein